MTGRATPDHAAELWDCDLTLYGTREEVQTWFEKLHDDYPEMIQGGYLGPMKEATRS